MDTAQFRLPVRILRIEGEPITEIYSAEEALDLLLAWPKQEGRVFDKAVEACFLATVEIEAVPHAEKAFVNFVRISGLLAKDMSANMSRRKGKAAAIHI